MHTRTLLVPVALVLVALAPVASASGPPDCISYALGNPSFCLIQAGFEDLDGREYSVDTGIAGIWKRCTAGVCTPWIPFCFRVHVVWSDNHIVWEQPCLPTPGVPDPDPEAP